jgi:hypothetical protein
VTVLYQRSSDALWRTSAGQVVLLVADGTDQPFTVTGPGAAMWGLLDVPATVDELATTLARTYDAPIQEIATSIELLLATLVDMRAVRTLVTS